VTVVSDSEDYWFVPSNPWVAVRWREADAIRVHLPPVMAKGHRLYQRGRARVHPRKTGWTWPMAPASPTTIW
jgi:sulfide:quinone oxidoreductase